MLVFCHVEMITTARRKNRLTFVSALREKHSRFIYLSGLEASP